MANPNLEMLHGMLYGKGLHFGQPSGLARIIAAMTGDHADVVPFQGPQIHDHAMTVAKVPARKYYWDAELLVDVHLAVCRWYTFDFSHHYCRCLQPGGGSSGRQDESTALMPMPTVDVSDPCKSNFACRSAKNRTIRSFKRSHSHMEYGRDNYVFKRRPVRFLRVFCFHPGV